MADITVTRTLTSAELLAMGETYPEIVAGVSGKYLWLQTAFAIYRAGSTPYTTAGGNITIGTQSGSISVLSADDALLGGAEDQILQFNQIATGGNTVASEAGVSLVAYNFGPYLADGDGTVELTITYREMPV